MAFWPNFKLFSPKLSPNPTKNGQFLPFLVQIRPKMVKIGRPKNLNNSAKNFVIFLRFRKIENSKLSKNQKK
jgi:hypothetical protein